MKFQPFELIPSELSEPDIEFRNKFDSFLDLCEFKIEEKLGILFILGATIPSKLETVAPNSSDFQSILKALSLYSKSTGDFGDYGDLDDGIFSYWIYNVNLAISKILNDDTPIDENLRTIPNSTVIIGKSEVNFSFLEKHEDGVFNLNVVQNLNDEFFTQIGQHLLERNYSLTKAYEAGFAYRMMMLNMDIKGTIFLLSRISSLMSPLFESLFYTPILFVLNNHAFRANHLFSHILNNFFGGPDSKLFPVAQPIHSYHQFVFYKPQSIELRDEWFFAKKVDDGSAPMIFMNAISIAKTNLKVFADTVRESGEVYKKELIDSKLNAQEFLIAILEVIQSKYSINGYDEFVTDSNGKWNTRWNNKGDYIQFLVILFYETCIHALATDEIL